MSSFTADLQGLIPRLRRYARALTRHGTAADDLVQDTLERCWARRRQWAPGSDLRAWSFAIMHNLFINELRRFEPDLADAPDLASAPAATDVLIDLERGLASLGPEQRAVVLLIGLEDLSYAQAALVLGVPVGTVMSRLARARERLRQLMDAPAERPALRVVR